MFRGVFKVEGKLRLDLENGLAPAQIPWLVDEFADFEIQ